MSSLGRASEERRAERVVRAGSRRKRLATSIAFAMVASLVFLVGPSPQRANAIDPPVITVNAPNPQVIEVGSPYVELGATATDDVDPDFAATPDPVDVAAVDTGTVGTYFVTYTATDSEDLAAAPVDRTVSVVDTTDPVITVNAPNPQVIEVGSPYVELGATAVDNYDGAFAATPNPGDVAAVDTGTVGTYFVTYTATDLNGNAAAPVDRTVSVVDTTDPVITVNAPNPQVIEVGSPYVELGATATDNVDPDFAATPNPGDVAAVDTGTVGTYFVTYTATDLNGNAAAPVDRTVSVVDTTDPVITVNAPNPQVIEGGSPYVELGATAVDNYDGAFAATPNPGDVAAVDTGTVGTYFVTYTATDLNGNAAAPVDRTVSVVDTTDPVITVNAPNPQVIEVGSPYVELGATATDNVDPDFAATPNPGDVAAVDTGTVGTYFVTYTATDLNGNAAAPVDRTVSVVDTTDPVITVNAPNPQVIEVGSPYVELGATAVDNYDGAFAATPNPGDVAAVDTGTVGTYFVTYTATDLNGNAAAPVDRTVSVVDTTDPVITLLGADPQIISFGDPYVELGATAVDNVDGVVAVTPDPGDVAAVNTLALGTYFVTYTATDLSGNAAAFDRTVRVVDPAAPLITLLGFDPKGLSPSAPMLVEVGSVFVDPQAQVTDNVDPPRQISGSSSSVNTAALGSYAVFYTTMDANGNPAVPVTRYVKVVDTTKPVITRTGAASVEVVQGASYSDAGATATDNYDNAVALTASITTTGLPDTSVVGTYTVRYNVSDSSGNAAVEVTRTVNVVAAPTVLDVVVVGGSSVVSDAVVAQLSGLVSGSVTRVSGANRYATAAAVSKARFAPGVPSVFIATGENFPDALAAVAPAGVADSPILLVRPDSVPGETAAELARLKPARIYVVGGSAVVSAATASQLTLYTSGPVVRVSGRNRYATAAAVSGFLFPAGVDVVYIATGENFPDALAGGPAGVVRDGPILLTRPGSLPAETAAELARMKPARIVVLGGAAAVSNAVASQLAAYTSGSVSRFAGRDRYATAAAVSQGVFAAGANVVFVATGLNFPDALAAGPAAGIYGGPILLSGGGSSLPGATVAEITRLSSK